MEPVSAIHSGSEESEDEQDSPTSVEEDTDSSEESSDSSEEDTEWLAEGYDPNDYLPRKPYWVEEVVIVGEDRALVPAQIDPHKYKGLVDTGASQSCISEKTYHNLDLPQLVELCEVRVSSATGTHIEVVGSVECQITLGNNHYLHNFIICRNIKRAMIIGLDFLKRFRIQTGWTEGGVSFK